MQQDRIGIFGAGSIAEAIVNGILEHGFLRPQSIYITNKKDDDRLKFFSQKYGVNTTRDLEEIILKCRYLFIAVKPADVKNLLLSIKKLIKEWHIIISVAAGITTDFINKVLEKEVQVVRAMPNTSCKVRESATAIAAGQFAKDEAIDFSKELFSAVGSAFLVDESLMDAVTGLSGSGPAYVYLLMESMIEAGERAGLPRQLSEKLTVQTLLGAAKMVRETGETPEALRQEVATPGGTTMAGLKVLEGANFTEIFTEAIENAARRSREMKEEYSSI